MDSMGHDFDSFYRTEFPSMVALAHTICGDSQLAEDLAQEAMTRAHKRWTELGDYDKPGAWLRRVTINLALTRRRRSMREVIGLGRHKLETLPAPEPPDEDVEVWEAVATLGPKQRAAVALFYQEGASTTEIAEILGCTVSTATSHLSQARQRLAGLLDKPVPDAVGDSLAAMERDDES